MMKRLEKPTINKPVVTSTKRDIDNEPTFTNVSGGSLDLFNYLNWVWASKSYRSQGEMKADWIAKNTNTNNNFMRAISHPQYGTTIKKVIDCNRIKLVNQTFMGKYNKKDWGFI